MKCQENPARFLPYNRRNPAMTVERSLVTFSWELSRLEDSLGGTWPGRQMDVRSRRGPTTGDEHLEMYMRKTHYCVLLLGWAWLLPWVAGANEAPQPHALEGVRIVVAPGEVIDSGTLVLRDGVIEAVGADVSAPPDAQRWQRDDLTVYAGWIEPYSVAGWPSPEGDEAAPQGGHDNALVTPQRDMAHHAFHAGRARQLRAAGFTSALVVPEEGMFRGQSALLNLGDGSLGHNLLKRQVAQHVTLSATAEDGYPSSLMGSIALARQTFYDAAWYGEAQDAYQRHRAQRRPAFDVALESLASASRGDQPVVFESEDMLGTLRAIRLADEFDLDAWIVGVGDEYKRLDAIVAGQRPLVLPLGFPDAPTVGEEDNLSLDIEELRHWQAAPENPQRLLEAGATVLFTSHGQQDPKSVHGHLVAAIKRGLDPVDALAALTTTPARLLGMSARLGTVEVGKIANLLVVEGDLWVEKPKLREVWVDGIRYELKELKPPEVDPVGTWDIVIDAGPGGKIPVQLVIQGEIGSLSGTIGSSAGTLPLGSVEVSGKAVEIAFDSTPFGMPGTIQIKLNVAGETASGSGTSPQGPFRLTGKRVSTPEVLQ